MAPAPLSSAAPGDATTGTEPTSGQASTRTDGRTKNRVEIKRRGRGRATTAGGWVTADCTGLGSSRKAKAKRQSSTTSERKGAERELPEGLRAEVLAGRIDRPSGLGWKSMRKTADKGRNRGWNTR